MVRIHHLPPSPSTRLRVFVLCWSRRKSILDLIIDSSKGNRDTAASRSQEQSSQEVHMQVFHKLKTIVPIALFSMLACSAFADGSVSFANSLASAIYLYTDAIHNQDMVTSATLGSQDQTGMGYGSTGYLDAGLVWGTTASSVSTIYGGTLAGIERIGSRPGELAGNPIFDVAGTVPGDYYYFQVFFWDSSFGDSLAGLRACVAAGGYFGSAGAGDANPAYGTVGTPVYTQVAPVASPGSLLFGFPDQGLFGSTVILDSPEPGTLLLTAAGAAGLLLFRRTSI
jgi:hypothetical protein